MPNDRDSCIVARDALGMAQELRVDMNALQRKTDRIEADKNRLGERVTASEERLMEHESITRDAIQKFDHTLDGLTETVSALHKTIETVSVIQPMPSGSAVIQSWKDTPTKHKSLILGGVVAVLLTPEILKPLISMAFVLVKRWLHIP